MEILEQVHGVSAGDIVKCISNDPQAFLNCIVGEYYPVGRVGKFHSSGTCFLEIRGYVFSPKHFEKITTLVVIETDNPEWRTFCEKINNICPKTVRVCEDGDITIDVTDNPEWANQIKSAIKIVKESNYSTLYDDGWDFDDYCLGPDATSTYAGITLKEFVILRIVAKQLSYARI